MSLVLTNDENYNSIANAIRLKLNTEQTYKPSEMADAIELIESTSVLEPLNVYQNGVYTPTSAVDGFNEVTVQVPNSYTNSDEGKVVTSGTLTAQVSRTIIANGTYDTTINNEVTVDVIGKLPVLTELIATQNGTYTPGTNVDGFDSVVVDVPQNIEGDGNIDAYVDNSIEGSIFLSTASEIKSFCFYKNNYINNITALSATVIQSQAFWHCDSLTQANFPNCIDIKASAFGYCQSLTQVNFPKCKIISNKAFENCQSLTQVSFPECTQIGTLAFNSCYALSEVNFPNCISNVGSTVFCKCKSLRQVNFPNCTHLTDYSAFANIPADVTFYLPNCRELSNEIFINTQMTSIELPAALIVGNGVFAKCNLLRLCSLPKCTTLGPRTFDRCSALESLYLLASSIVSGLYANTFDDTPMVNSTYLGYFGSIYVPESLVADYKANAQWSSIADRITAYTGE